MYTRTGIFAVCNYNSLRDPSYMWNLFCFMKKVRLVLASPTHKKMRESLIFSKPEKKCSARSFWQRGQTRHEKIEISKKNSMNPKFACH